MQVHRVATTPGHSSKPRSSLSAFTQSYLSKDGRSIVYLTLISSAQHRGNWQVPGRSVNTGQNVLKYGQLKHKMQIFFGQCDLNVVLTDYM